MDERELVSLAQRGDEAAFAALVRPHLEMSYRVAYVLAGSAGELLHQRQAGLALPVFDQGKHRRGAADLLAEFGQRQAFGPPGVPEPLAEHCKV